MAPEPGRSVGHRFDGCRGRPCSAAGRRVDDRRGHGEPGDLVTVPPGNTSQGPRRKFRQEGSGEAPHRGRNSWQAEAGPVS